MAKGNKPDYQWWAKKDVWTLKESTFLLHDLDPFPYRSLRIYDNDTPEEFREEQRTYFLLRSVPWSVRYPKHYFCNDGMHPLAVVREAINKKLPISIELIDAVQEQYPE